MLPNTRWFRLAYGTILLLLIIYLVAKVSFLFRPIATMFNILIVPFMLAGFFYYLLRPIVNYLTARKMNRFVAVLFIYLLLGAFLAIFFMSVWPALVAQIELFAEEAPQLIEGFREQMLHLQQNRMVAAFTAPESDLTAKVSEYVGELVNRASAYLNNVIQMVTGFVIAVTTAPFILYYMLKEGDTLPHYLIGAVPRRYRPDGVKALREIDAALSGFILGRMIITFLLGVMMYIGFLVIGLPYALLVTVIATVLNLIPYLGPILGAIPCVLVAFTASPSMVFWSLVVTVAAQQIEGNLLSPLIYGKRMDVHPLTTILLLLVAGEIAGILGIILCIPFYMVVKITIMHVYDLFLAEKVEELVE
ncbi:AI-2E family transporter [Paenibacillus xanthanilyticus]|uniref:AI-2E family transporter n=1 Tax=Paenibacillus xanthanilyticus TaxID=1783531 RepID=A0ABV8KB76_9BACL